MTIHYDIDWLRKKFESGETMDFIFFWEYTNEDNAKIGKHCLSQWFESHFIVDTITYKTAEHWMMAQKALLFGDDDTSQKIIKCYKPEEAKKLGRLVKGYEDQIWNENKFEIVKQGNIHKFSQNSKLADFLLKTDNKILVEASPYDKIWGIGLSQDSIDITNINVWRGQNLLGFALMETRDYLLGW